MTASCLAHGAFGIFAPIALVPWILAMLYASRAEAIAVGAFFGTLYGALVVYWIPEALQSLGSSQLSSIGGLALTAGWAKAPLFALLGLLTRELRNHPSIVVIAAVGAALAAGEQCVSLWSWGIPAAFVGHSQRTILGVAQLAVVGGVPVISGFVASISSAIALAMIGDPTARRAAIAMSSGHLAMALMGLPVAEAARPATGSADGSVYLLAVQPDLPRHARWENAAQDWILRATIEQTQRALESRSGRVDAIAWPENLVTSRVDVGSRPMKLIQQHVDEWATPLVTGVVRSALSNQPRTYRSSVLWFEPKSGVIASVDKYRAVPLVEGSREFWGRNLIEAAYGEAARWQKVEESLSVGRDLAGRFSVATVLCFEGLFPRLVTERRNPETVGILNLVDDSWVSGPSATRQLAGWTAFRAIEQRLTLVRIAHGGLSQVVDPFGRVTRMIPEDAPASALVELRPQPLPTLAERAIVLALPFGVTTSVWWFVGFTSIPRAAKNTDGAFSA